MAEQPFSSRETEADTIARLLRLAGPRTVVPEDRAARVKAATRDVWRRSLVNERRQRRAQALVLSLAAAALVLIVLRPSHHVRPALPRPVVAVVEVIRGVGAGTDPSPALLAVGTGVRAGEAITTPIGARLSLRLGAGPSVRVDEGTRLRMLSAVDLALERGAVYVDSGEAHRGLRVTTRLGSVTDVGTQFEARLSSSRLRVRVRAGRVSVTEGGVEQTAVAGEELTFDGEGFRRASVPAGGGTWGWAVGLSPAFDVDGQTLGAFLARLRAETHWRFRFYPRALETGAGAIVLHGSLAGLEPEEALDAALAASGLRGQRRPDGFLIERFTGSEPAPATER